MPSNVYCANVTGSYEISSDRLAVEIQAPSGTAIKIKKIRVMHSDGTQTAVADYTRNIRFVRESAVGTGGTSFTPKNLDPTSTASVSTVKTGPMIPGTISETVDSMSVHSNTDFLWVARDEDDKIVVAANGIFGVVINTQ